MNKPLFLKTEMQIDLKLLESFRKFIKGEEALKAFDMSLRAMQSCIAWLDVVEQKQEEQQDERREETITIEKWRNA